MLLLRVWAGYKRVPKYKHLHTPLKAFINLSDAQDGLIINQEPYQENNCTPTITKPIKKDLLCPSKEEQIY